MRRAKPPCWEILQPFPVPGGHQAPVAKSSIKHRAGWPGHSRTALGEREQLGKEEDRCQEQTRGPRAVTDQSPAPAREGGPGVVEKTTSWICAPTCSGRRRRGPPNSLDRSPAAGLWLRTGSQFPSVKLTLPLRGVRYATFRPGVQRRARTGETSADPAAQRSPAAAGNRCGRVWEPTSRRPPPARRSHLADGASRSQPGPFLAVSRAVRSVLGDHRRSLFGPRPPGGRRRRRDPGCAGPRTALSWGWLPGRQEGRGAGLRACETSRCPIGGRGDSDGQQRRPTRA